jgi:hypothetical protein
MHGFFKNIRNVLIKIMPEDTGDDSDDDDNNDKNNDNNSIFWDAMLCSLAEVY